MIHAAATGFIALVLAIIGSVAHDVATINDQPVHCAYEDSAGPCVWDAQVDGNGKGQSFTVPAAGRHPKYLP